MTQHLSGAERIAAERKRQIEVEGWTPDHDAEHGFQQLVRAASCYLFQYLSQVGWFPRRQSGIPPRTAVGSIAWPWETHWWKPSADPIRNLEKAGALIAAEIDRLQRAAENDEHGTEVS